MIIYSSIKQDFINDVISNTIDDKVLSSFIRETGHSINPREILALRNSMRFMRDIIEDPEIPNNAGVAIEYIIPQTSKRIDFIVTGLDDNNKETAIIIELKQWDKAELTEMDGIVKTYVGNGYREVSHPSYQVWSYALFLKDYNQSIQQGNIRILPCAYLHNYSKKTDKVINNKFYEEYLQKAPVFYKEDVFKLRKFIKRFVKQGDNKTVLYKIENGKIKPSKALADALASMLKGNKEFVLLDDQKVVYEKAINLALKSNNRNKNVLIVEGGPGTGKSVVAINLLSEFINRGILSQYVTKNAAPREVFKIKLTGKFTRTRIDSLFRGSGSYHRVSKNFFDVLIVDEAHRLNEKSSLFNNAGENQIKELINAAKCTIFFIDENQRVTLKDIGSKEEIKKWAKKLGAKVTVTTLSSQFRCNGSDGYLAWIDNTLQIRNTANFTLKDIEYDFQVFDDPQLLHQKIIEKNKLNNKSRVVAGYTWDWISKKNPSYYDIQIGNYKARWNLTKHGAAWLAYPESVNEVGCIHTCQGLDLDYVGVIIGPDLIVRDNKVITDYKKRAKTDQSLKGIVKIAKEKGEEYAQKIAEPIIKNTYRTLMTRGMKGCYIYSEDEETREYFRKRIKNTKENSYNATPDGSSFVIDK